jgi:hypothetical protein
MSEMLLTHKPDEEVHVESRDEKIAKLAAAYHDAWRLAQMKDDGTLEPQLETTTDEEWIDTHGTDQVDIINTEYSDLPADWQAENKAAADVALGIMEQIGGKVDLSDPEQYSSAGTIIHNAWLSRNVLDEDRHLFVPFDELSQEEKDKDIRQIEIANAILG